MTATLSFIVLQGQTVMVRDFRSNSHKWMKGIVLQQLGPVTYTVEVDGKLLKRRVDHLRQRSESASPPESRTDHTIQDNFQYPEPHTELSEQVCSDEPSPQEPLFQCYPRRDRQPPDRLMV